MRWALAVVLVASCRAPAAPVAVDEVAAAAPTPVEEEEIVSEPPFAALESASEPAPAHDVPRLFWEGRGCSLIVGAELGELDDDVAAVAFTIAGVADAERPPEVPCSEEFLAAELGRGAFDSELLNGAFVGYAGVELSPPAVPCEGFIAVRTCVRDRQGRLRGSEKDRANLVELGDRSGFASTVFETPSGQTKIEDLSPGHVLLAREPKTGTVLETKVQRFRRRQSPGIVGLLLDQGQRIEVPAAREYWVQSSGAFKRAEQLAAGDTLVTPDDSEVRVLGTKMEPPSPLSEDVPDVGFPDTFFVDGLLVRDFQQTKGAPSGAPVLHRAPDPSGEFVPKADAYDCGILTQLRVGPATDVEHRLELVVVKHRGSAGARRKIDCDGGITLASIPPESLARAASSAPGSEVVLTIEYDYFGSCNAAYDMVSCRVADDGREPVAAARYVKTGPACIAEGTPVDTPRGPVAIEALRRGDSVWSFDLELDKRILGRVTGLRRVGTRPVATLELGGGEFLRATRDHLIFSPAIGDYRPAAEFRRGSELFGGVSVEKMGAFDEEAVVYDLSIDGPSNYFANGVLVHNY